MSNWNYAKELPMKDWVGQDTSPRRYYITDGDLRQMYETTEFLDKISTSNTFLLSNSSIEFANIKLKEFTKDLSEL